MKNLFKIFIFSSLSLIIVYFAIALISTSKEEKGMGVIPSASKLASQYCEDTKGNRLSYEEALQIAQKGPCATHPESKITFTQNYSCNSVTGTFWVDINVSPESKGCNPACVVNLVTKSSEINWRCTGLIPSK